MIGAMILIGLATLGQGDRSGTLARVEPGDHVESFSRGFFLYESRGWSRYEGRPPLKVLQIRPEQFLVELRTGEGAVRQGWIPSKDVRLSKPLPALGVLGHGIRLVPVFEFPVPPGPILGAATERTNPIQRGDRVIARHQRLPLCFSPDGRYVAFVGEGREAAEGIELVDLDSGGTRLNIPSTTARPGLAFNADGSALAVWNPAAKEPTIEVYQTRDARRIGSIRCRSQFCDRVTYSSHSIALMSGVKSEHQIAVEPVRFAADQVIAARRLAHDGLREARWDIRSGQLIDDRPLTAVPDQITSRFGREDPEEIEKARQIRRIELLDVADRKGDEIYQKTVSRFPDRDSDYVGLAGDHVVMVSYTINPSDGPSSMGVRTWRSLASFLSITIHNRVLRSSVEQLAEVLDELFSEPVRLSPDYLISLTISDPSHGRPGWSKTIGSLGGSSLRIPTVLCGDKAVAVVYRDLCKIYGSADGKLLSTIWLDQKDLTSRRVSLSPAGGFLVVVPGSPAATRIYDASTGEEVTGFSARHVQFSPDERWVATWFPSDDLRAFAAEIPGAKGRTIRHAPSPEGLRIWRLQRAGPAGPGKRD